MGESVGICVPGGLSSRSAAEHFLQKKCGITDPTEPMKASAESRLSALREGKLPNDFAWRIPLVSSEWRACGGKTPQVIPAEFAICTEAQAMMGGTVEPKQPIESNVVIKVKRGEQSINFAEQLKIVNHKGSLFIKLDDTNVCSSLSTSGSGDNRQVNIGRQVNAGTTFDIIVELRDGATLLESYRAKIEVVEDDKQGKKGGKTGEKKPAGSRPIAGKCGLNAKEFSAETHTLSGRGMCAAGKSEPKTVTFGSRDLVVRWQCLGKNGGAADDCAASRKAPAPAAAARIAPAPVPVAPPPPPPAAAPAAPAPVAAPPVPAPVAAPAPASLAASADEACSGIAPAKKSACMTACEAKFTTWKSASSDVEDAEKSYRKCKARYVTAGGR